MRFSFGLPMLGTLAAWAPLVAARPLAMPEPAPSAAEDIEGGQLSGRSSGEGSHGGCKSNIFIFARGTGEPGLMGYVVGPPVTNALKKALGDHAVAAEGVKYSAGFAGNMSPGSDPAGVNMMKKQVAKAAKDCPQSNILLGGYSQGAGLAHHAIQGLSRALKERVVGVVLFGDPSLIMGNGKIPGFPAVKVKEFCAAGDPVCGSKSTGDGGSMSHVGYGASAPKAARFLVARIRAAHKNDDGAKGGDHKGDGAGLTPGDGADGAAPGGQGGSDDGSGGSGGGGGGSGAGGGDGGGAGGDGGGGTAAVPDNSGGGDFTAAQPEIASDGGGTETSDGGVGSGGGGGDGAGGGGGGGSG